MAINSVDEMLTPKNGIIDLVTIAQMPYFSGRYEPEVHVVTAQGTYRIFEDGRIVLMRPEAFVGEYVEGTAPDNNA